MRHARLDAGPDGLLLVNRGKVEDVERAIERWMSQSPRVHVEVERSEGAGISRKALLELIREKVADGGKIDVVASEAERRAMHRKIAAMMRDNTYRENACTIGDELPANSVLRAGVASGQLYLKLLSLKSGCLIQSSAVPWSRSQGRLRAGEAVAALINKIRTRPQMPGGAMSTPIDEVIGERVRPNASVGRSAEVDIDDAPPAVSPQAPSSRKIVSFESEPSGAVVRLDGRLLCQDNSKGCSKVVALGVHGVTMEKEGYLTREETIRIGDDTERLRWVLERNSAFISVISDPPGLGAKIDGREIGTTPIARHEVVPGTYEVLVSDRRYFDKGKRITVARGGHGEVRVKLEAKIAWLNIESNPPGLDVTLDGKVVGQSPLAGFEVEPGSHEVLVQSNCHHKKGKRLTLVRGETRALTLDPGPKQAEVDVVAVDGDDNAVRADVFVDDDRVGPVPWRGRVSVCAKTLRVAGQNGSWEQALA